MKPEDLFELIGETDEELLAHSETKQKKWNFKKLAVPAACALLAMTIAVPFLIKGEPPFLLTDTVGNYRYEIVDTISPQDLGDGKYVLSGQNSSAYNNYTPQELLSQDVDILRGKITKLENLKITKKINDNTTYTQYYTRVHIRIERMLRGTLPQTDIVTVLLPYGCYIEQGDVKTIFQTNSLGERFTSWEKDAEGIFLLKPNDEERAQIAAYSISDARYCIMAEKDGIGMADMWKGVLGDSLDEAEEYIRTSLE